VKENSSVSDGESLGGRSVLLLFSMSAGSNAEGWLEKRLVAESASAVMYASMALNWFQFKT
jgi:hypothetical protein